MFSKLYFFRSTGCWKSKKMVQNDKKFCLSHFIAQESYIIWLSFMVQMCKMINLSWRFFQFFKIVIFQAVTVLKGQKMVQIDKKFCLSHLVSQESIMMQMSKMIIYPGGFFNFSKLWFFRSSGCCKGKKWPEMTKNSVLLHISETIHHIIGVWYTCVKS